MQSRAAILIERQLIEIDKSTLKGIEVIQSYEKNKFQWSVKIKGPSNTIWEGGLFKLAVLFEETYNYKPPTIVFITIPFHPNVDPVSGRLCMDYLDNPEKWNSDVMMTSVLQTVREVLGKPQLDYVINYEAEDLYLNSQPIYNQLVKECVMVSRSIDEPLYTRKGNYGDDAGQRTTILEYDEAFVDRMNAKETEKRSDNNVARISFEDYHSTWSGIATSKAKSESKNPHLKVIEGQATLLSVHHGVKFEEIEDHLTRQLEQHKSFVYGNFTRDTPQFGHDDKIIRLEQMRKIYLAQKTPSNLSRRDYTRMSILEQPEQFMQPQEPIVQLQEPIVQLQEPIMQPQEPIVQLQEPIMQPQEPIMQPQEPIMQPQESVPTFDIKGTPIDAEPALIELKNEEVNLDTKREDEMPISQEVPKPDFIASENAMENSDLTLRREETTIPDEEVDELEKWANDLNTDDIIN